MPLAAPVTSTRIALPPGRFRWSVSTPADSTETEPASTIVRPGDAITLKDSIARRRHGAALTARRHQAAIGCGPARGHARVAHAGYIARDGRVVRDVDLPPCLCPNWAPGRGTNIEMTKRTEVTGRGDM